MEIDLNQEPLDSIRSFSQSELDSFWDELESPNRHIHRRFRHLEAVSSRARERHRWPPAHNPIQITNFTADTTAAADDAEGEGREENQEVEEGITESAKGSERKGADLVAKALGVERDRGDGRIGNFFDCNICLDTARDPIVTCCGHLYCWPCFYQLSYVYPSAKECPVCKGEVTDNAIFPIYGSDSSVGSQPQLELTENGVSIPPRPRAPRVESIRQQLVSQVTSPSVIIRNVQRYNNIIGGLGQQAPSGPNNALPAQPTHSHQIQRLVVQGAASFSSLQSAVNSALYSADRIVEDLESYIHGHQTGGSTQINPGAVNRGFTSSVAVARNRPGSRAQIVTATAAATNSRLQIRLSDPSSSNTRRRTDASLRDSSERRRRRLR
ncbi:hypothetical protein RIF29_13591 [Crotalaria pallida]|uniref:E3 ubiquitin-protein ligase RMA n=1 Tax=Crotalaria pallida TaxID=3830 RepID=A0AAN9IPS4_CROPI